MNPKIKFYLSRFSTLFLFFVSTLLIFVGLHTFYNKYAVNFGFYTISNVAETNSFQLDINKFLLGARNSQLVFSSAATTPSKTTIYSASRKSNSIQQSIIEDNKISKISSYPLNSIIESFNNFKTDFYIFDLEMDSYNLYISLIPTNKSPLSCSRIILVHIPIQNGLILNHSGKILWDSNFCIDTQTQSDNLYQLQGKLLMNSKYIYMATGNVEISTFVPKTSNGDQNLNLDLLNSSIFGKVIQINKSSGLGKIIASGLRSPGGLTFSNFLSKKYIYVSDHGPRGGDELNLIKGGENFGWPYFTHGIPYYPNERNKKTKFNSFSSLDFIDPIYFWTPSIAPSSMIMLPEPFGFSNFWNENTIVMASLKSESLFHIVLIDNKVVNVEQIRIGLRLRDMSYTNGAILVSTDNGLLLKFSPSHIPISPGPFPAVYPNSLFYTHFYVLNNLSIQIDKLLNKMSAII